MQRRLVHPLAVIHVRNVHQEHQVVDHSAYGLVEEEFYEHVALACVCGGGLVFERFLRGGAGYAGGEHVFEEGLPEDVRGVADEAEDGEFDDGGEAEGEGRLEGLVCRISYKSWLDSRRPCMR